MARDTPEVKPSDPAAIDADKIAPLAARGIGPAIFSGRIADIAVNPADHAEFYLAVASGNVWKTTNSGITFTPVFDSYGSYSIGCVTIDPANAHTVWVGTGENNSQRSVGWGDGVYVSRDSGKSFTNVGLKDSGHIGMIRVDPRDSNVVYAAAFGPLWSDGGDRGLFKTADGGKTWNNILTINAQTGISEVHLDPRNPDRLYAVAYQRRRHVWTLINGGPGCAIHTSTDAGKTWSKLGGGLPKDGVGRIGLAISPANPDVLYATIETNDAETRGIYRSTNRGETWERRSGYLATSPQYYQELFADPKDPERFYTADTFLHTTDDGGATMRRAGEADKHVDNHAVWIDPTNTNHLLIGCDGGLYETFDRCKTYRHFENLPVMQFYRCALDNARPFYTIYGGTQDNATIGGPSRTIDRAGITNEDWYITTGGDGFETVVDPTDHNIVYSESQDGGLVRFDRRSGEEVSIKPMPKADEKPFVFNWDTPLLLSPHKPTRLYYAGNYLFRSDDRGDSWTIISGDLTRNLDRNQIKVMGEIQKPDAVAKHMSTSIFGNAVALDESPKKEGLIYVGTDDGLIHITEDGGASWRKVETVAGVPDMTYVADLTASVHDDQTLLACFDNHKMGDYLPYVMKSADRGRTWASIAGDLPKNCTCYCIVQDHVNPELLFVATEFGAFVTVNGGVNWHKLGGLPTIAVRDLDIQREHNDLVMASFGRGFFVLDDYSPLRTISPEVLGKPAHLFPVRDAVSFIEKARVGGTKGRGNGGASYYTAPNPPFGATFTYHLKEKIASINERRKEAEKKEGWSYPTIEQFRAEDAQAKPKAVAIIRDAKGSVIRHLDISREAGLHRETWNLRYGRSTPVSLSSGEKDPWEYDLDGTLVPPGTYSITIASIIDGTLTELTSPQTLVVRDLELATLAAKGEARNEKFEFERRAAATQRAAESLSLTLDSLETTVGHLAEGLKLTPGIEAKGLAEFEAARVKLRDLRIRLDGDPTLNRRVVAQEPSIRERVQSVVDGALLTTQPPTRTHRDQLELAESRLRELTPAVEAFRAELQRLTQQLREPGLPPIP